MATKQHHFPSLDARCPACGEYGVLYRGFQGRITCSGEKCPDAGAVHNLLNDPQIMEHLVRVTDHGWTIRHPLRERIGDALFACDLGNHLTGQRAKNPDLSPGVYRLDSSPRGRVWHLTPVGETVNV